MGKKKILIHSIVFSPDGVSTAYLYNDIALGLKNAGYEVVVLTTTPHYNRVIENLRNQPFHKRMGGIFYQSSFHNIKVFHVPQRKFSSTVLRIFGFVYWHILSVIIGLVEPRVSMILSPSPPLTIGLVSLLLGRLKGAKVVYNVQEIYPDLLINQGKLRFRMAIRILKRMEKIVYNCSDAITTIDEVFYNTIIGRINDPSKLRVIPNFVDTDLYRPLSDSEKSYDHSVFTDTKELKLMYAGNIGYAQDWEPLVHLAKTFQQESVSFWVIGEGVMKEPLKNQLNKLNLSNVHVLPYQPREAMPSLIAYSDLQFIFMEPKLDGQGFPSKVYTIMACGKPMLVISGKGTPLHGFLQGKDCALLVADDDSSDRLQHLESIIHSLLVTREQLEKLGRSGLEVIRTSFSKSVVVAQYVQLANELTT